MDFSLYPHAHTAVHHVAHAAPQIKTVIHNIPVGVTYMTAVISSAISFAIGAGLAWYIRGRGMTGVQNDLNNIKTDIVDLKNKIDPSAPTPAPAA